MKRSLLSAGSDSAIQRLTALWALSESGIGGIMFALKIPFTGFVMGAVSLILLSLIATFSNNSPAKILGATVIVLIVKAAVSPHSPLPAYLAVSFQGLSAALLFRVIPHHRTACILAGMITMAESALQKILVLTLIFGKQLWAAVNAFITELGKTFSLHAQHNYAGWLIGIYTAFYLLWGAFVGVRASGIFKAIEKNREKVLNDYAVMQQNILPGKAAVKRSRGGKRFIFFGATLLFITAVFFLSGAAGGQLAWILLRSVAAVLLLFVVLRPIIKYAVKKWLQSRPAAQQRAAADIIALMPQLSIYVNAAYRMATPVKGNFKRLGSFVLNAIILSLYAA